MRKNRGRHCFSGWRALEFPPDCFDPRRFFRVVFVINDFNRFKLTKSCGVIFFCWLRRTRTETFDYHLDIVVKLLIGAHDMKKKCRSRDDLTSGKNKLLRPLVRKSAQSYTMGVEKLPVRKDSRGINSILRRGEEERGREDRSGGGGESRANFSNQSRREIHPCEPRAVKIKKSGGR